MYENEYMYAIERNGDYLAHYGIKGMRWGVRKAIERGNSKALSKQYAKAQKKLAKLEKRASNGKKYVKRAAALGAGAAMAGTVAGLGPANVTRGAMKGASAVTKGVSKATIGLGNLMKKSGNKRIQLAGYRVSTAGHNVGTASSKINLAGRNAGNAIDAWGNSNSIGNALAKGGSQARNAIQKVNIGYGKVSGSQAIRRLDDALVKSGNVNTQGQLNKLSKVSNNTFARIGAGALGAGMAAGAGYNAYRAATTKRAAKKAAAFRSEMNKAFKGTQYANGAPRQGNKRRKRR